MSFEAILKFNNKYLYVAVIFFMFFVSLENVYAYEITFKQSEGKFEIGTCSTYSNGKLSSDCISKLAKICGRWSPHNLDKKAHGSIYISTTNWYYDKMQWEDHLCVKSGLYDCSRRMLTTDYIFNNDGIYYCVAGSSTPYGDKTKGEDACYECKDNTNIMKWSMDDNADERCAVGYNKTEKSKEECDSNIREVCYVCKDEGKSNIKTWTTDIGEELPGDGEDGRCVSGYKIDEGITTETSCQSNEICYQCAQYGFEHIMHWGYSAPSSKHGCTSFVETNIFDEDKCKSEPICYVCKDKGKSNIKKEAYNGNGDTQCDSYAPVPNTHIDDCVSPENSLTCANVWGDSTKISDSTSCEANKTEANFNQCSKVKVGAGGGYKIYVPVGSDACNKVELPSGSEKYYMEITVEANVLINQVGNFKFSGINESIVKAGKGFTIGETTYINNITWIIADINNENKPYYDYTYNAQKLVSGACVPNKDFSLEAKKNNSEFYYYDSNGDFIGPVKLEDASFAVINKAVNNELLNKDGVGEITFKSYDSNNSRKDDFVKVDGTWEWKNPENYSSIVKGNGFTVSGVSINYDSNFGKKIIRNYVYNLADSAVSVSGDDYAKALYGQDVEDAIAAAKAINTGKKFYIDFKWIYGGYWPFNIGKANSNANTDSVNPSLVNGMIWDLTGTCGVNVEDGYYKDADGDGLGTKVGLNYKYRSISLAKPFPKANQTTFDDITATNWRDWFSNNENNRNRIYNTLDNNYDYSLHFSKLNGSGIISISEIKEISKSKGYGSYDGFNVDDGTSDFLKENFILGIKTNANNYCGLGFFSEDCNQVS